MEEAEVEIVIQMLKVVALKAILMHPLKEKQLSRGNYI
jgi:hypothetical protein